jgi:hypothetical protein
MSAVRGAQHGVKPRGAMMLAFEIQVNGKRVAIAGAEDLAVLSAIVSATGRLGPKTNEHRRARRMPDIWLHGGGLTARPAGIPDEHLNWVQHRTLRVGDRVSIRVIRVTRAHNPVSSSPASDKSPSSGGRAFFNAVKAQYLKLRKRYEKRGLTTRSTRARRAERAG